MKKSVYTFLSIITVAFILTFASCKKDSYLQGGTINNPHVNMSAYDYLNSNSMQLFDTVLMIIDKAGLKDAIDQQGITFFVPTDYAVYSYLNARTIELQLTDPTKKYTLDSLLNNDISRVKDSLGMYIINQNLTYDKLTDDGAIYNTNLNGDKAVVSFEYTQDPVLGYNEAVSSVPQMTYFTQLWKQLDPPFKAGDIPDDVGVHTLCQTSGIEVSNGSILNVLENSHTLFFYGTQK